MQRVKNLNWFLKNNNISTTDLVNLIAYLSKNKLKLSHGNNVVQIEQRSSNWQLIVLKIEFNNEGSKIIYKSLREV